MNHQETLYEGDQDRSLLSFLRGDKQITSVKDGCSGQAACGACLVELDGKPALACSTRMKRVADRKVITIEGFPETVRRTLGMAFVAQGAVQCGFCTPGMLSRAKILLDENPNPSREDVVKALKANVCRCTGYVKIIDGILLAAEALRNGREIDWEQNTRIGYSYPKYEAYEKALGVNPFINDMTFEGMLYGVLKFSAHPRARVVNIDTSGALKIPGIIRVFLAADIPGQRHQGIKVQDWPMIVEAGEETRYIGDAIAGVVAESEELAREGVEAIRVDYEVLDPLTEVAEAAESTVKIHTEGNLLSEMAIRRGEEIEGAIRDAAHVVEGVFETPFVEHAFLETEASIGLPGANGGVTVYSQGQGIFSDRTQIASVLNLPEERVEVVQVSTGGAFGGKEDLSVQHHAALYAMTLGRPVLVRLSRPDSIRMHPKRHRMKMEYKLACDDRGYLTALKARILGDTGAYASVGSEVVSRTGTHACGAYYVPNVDVVARAYHTNNPPAGAFRGFGVNQSNFAMESLVDELCKKGGFDRWQFRYDNVLTEGKLTTTGQVLGEGVGLRHCLDALKEEFYKAEYAGIACAIKNCGIGDGVEEISDTRLTVISENRIELYHGWTEMGQGINTVARQLLCSVLDLDDSFDITIKCHTGSEAVGGMTTASRGSVLLGNSVLGAAEKLKADLHENTWADLVGRSYTFRFSVDWTTPLDEPGDIVSHFSYGYAAQMAILDSDGRLSAIHAAHDGGKIINPALFEGQVEGGVVMGMGYAVSEQFPLKDGRLTSDRMSKLNLPKAKDVPDIKVIGVECPDTMGPFGLKGVGEIGTIPTAPAIANAFCSYDGKRRYSLPLSPIKKKRT